MDRYADILEQPVSVFGSRDAAEHWMTRPAIGLERRKRRDLICKSGEAVLIKTYLTRLEYGVSC